MTQAYIVYTLGLYDLDMQKHTLKAGLDRNLDFGGEGMVKP